MNKKKNSSWVILLLILLAVAIVLFLLFYFTDRQAEVEDTPGKNVDDMIGPVDKLPPVYYNGKTYQKKEKVET